VTEAFTSFERGSSLAAEAGDRSQVALFQIDLGVQLGGCLAADEYLQHGLTIARELDDPHMVLGALVGLSRTQAYDLGVALAKGDAIDLGEGGDPERSLLYLREARELAHALRDPLEDT